MSTSAEKVVFAPRPNLKRTLTFRPIVKTCYYWYSIYLAFQAVYLIWVFISKTQEGVPFLEAVQFGNWVLLSFGFGLNHFVLRRLTRSKIHVHSNGISLQVNEKTTEVLFGDILELKLPQSFFGTRGYFVVKMKSGQRYYFSVALERSEYVLEAIASVRPEIVDLERLADFRINAIATDHLLARMKSNIDGSWGKSLIRYFISPFVQALIVLWLFKKAGYLDQSLPSLWIYFVVTNVGIGIFSDFLVNFFMKNKTKLALAKNPKAVIRDMAGEKKNYRISNRLHWGLCFCFFAYFLFQGLSQN